MQRGHFYGSIELPRVEQSFLLASATPSLLSFPRLTCAFPKGAPELCREPLFLVLLQSARLYVMATNSVFPPDPESDVGLCRVLIPDAEQHKDPQFPAEPASYMYEDWQITAFLKLNGDKIKAAAADAIDALATNEAMVSKKIRTEDLQTDGPAVANAMRLHATALRAAQAREDLAEDMLDSFNVIDFIQSPQPWPIR